LFAWPYNPKSPRSYGAQGVQIPGRESQRLKLGTSRFPP